MPANRLGCISTRLCRACMHACTPQAYWLILALVQDNPKNRHLEQLRDQVEREALNGQWVSFEI